MYRFYKENAVHNLSEWLQAKAPSQQRTVCIFKPDGIGDFVISSGAIAEIITQYGSSNSTLIISKQVENLALSVFPGVKLLPITPGHQSRFKRVSGLLKLRRAIRAYAYEDVICLRHYRNLYEFGILRAIHTRRTILLPNRLSSASVEDAPSSFCYVEPPNIPSLVKGTQLPTELSFHSAVLSVSLNKLIEPIKLVPNWSQFVTNDSKSGRTILVAPLAGRPIRHIPEHILESTVKSAISFGITHFQLTGSKDQLTALNQIADRLRTVIPYSNVEVLLPPNLSQLVALIANSSIVVSAETSTAHIATALDKPSIILIGGGHFGLFAPWQRSNKQIWLTNRIPCFGCNWQCIYPEPRCLTKIKATDIHAAFQSVLTESGIAENFAYRT